MKTFFALGCVAIGIAEGALAIKADSLVSMFACGWSFAIGFCIATANWKCRKK